MDAAAEPTWMYSRRVLEGLSSPSQRQVSAQPKSIIELHNLTYRTKGSSKGGYRHIGTVCSMDAAAEPTWTYSRRVPVCLYPPLLRHSYTKPIKHEAMPPSLYLRGYDAAIIARLTPTTQDNSMEPMINIALRAARKAGENIVRASDDLERFEVKAKGVNNFVSEVDINAEQEIIYHLQKAYPDHAIMGEESGLTGSEDAEYRWIIDPLDGTTNFIRGIPHYAVSVACTFKGKLEHAVIVDPVRREEFTASRGRGAQLNGHRIRVSKLASLDGALLGTGIPFKEHCDDKLGPYSQSMELLAGQCAGIRRAGAASLDLAYVAAGRLDAFWEIGLAPWDIAAGALLVREAGGLVADIDGSDGYLESGNIVCGNPKCFKAVLQTVKPLLG
jgi:myo-inositol-1(or 4)-monophosphatase